MDHYQVLGVSRDAAQSTIKKAYRRLAMKHHPDKGGDQLKFQEVQQAYTVLSDPQQRRKYDNPDPFGNENNPFGPNSPFQDIFTDIFGMGRQPMKNPDGIMDVQITLLQAYTGIDYTVGTPEGQVKLTIPPGTKSQTKFRITGKVTGRMPNLPPGDLIVRIHVNSPPEWGREDDDLYIRAEITAIEAMIGTKLRITHINEKQYEVNIKPGTQPGERIRMAGLGMPNPQNGRVGNLFILIQMHVPTIDDEEDIKLLNKLVNKRKGYG